MTLRVVFDTNVVISALLFRSGRLAWLRAHWMSGQVLPLASTETVTELVGALAYPKFKLTKEQVEDRLGAFLSYAEVAPGLAPSKKSPRCRDIEDQKFIDLAVAARADVLVTGDQDLLALKADVAFAIETPLEYRRRFDLTSAAHVDRALARLMVTARDIEAFCKRHGIRKLSFFGSVMRDDFHEESDVDVVVEFESAKLRGVFAVVELGDELSKLFSGRKVDVLTTAEVSNPIRREHIKRDLTVIVEG